MREREGGKAPGRSDKETTRDKRYMQGEREREREREAVNVFIITNAVVIIIVYI